MTVTTQAPKADAPPAENAVTFEEGQLCPMAGDDCCGRLRFVKDGDCSCHLAPPCGACVDSYLECDYCSWSTKENV